MWALAVYGLMVAVFVVGWRRSGQPALDFFGLSIMRAYARLYHNIWIRRQADLPATGPALLVANHTCSADPSFLQACAGRAMSFLIAEEYFDIPGAGWLFRYMRCIPVARNGHDITSVRT